MRFLMVLGLLFAGACFGEGLPPLSDAARSAFEGIEQDPSPKAITRNSHYWVSNEYQHDLFLPALKDIGGVHIGVGSDQNYLFAGWSKPEVLVLFDFDGQIPRLHQIYKVAFAHAPTPDAFYALWTEAGGKELAAWAKAELPEGKARKQSLRALRAARVAIRRRLKITRRAYIKRKIPTFLTDQAQYDHVRDLWAKGRVFTVRGDLTASVAMRGVAAAAKTAGLTVRSLYMSNAEQYFDYGAAFRENIGALPFDDKSVVLHTIAWSGFGFADGHYHYAVQPGLNFQLWMKESKIKNLPRMLRHRSQAKREGFSTIEATPAEVAAARAKRKKSKPRRRK